MTNGDHSGDLTALQALWPLPGPWVTRPVPENQGFNNETRFVDTPTESVVLRVYAESNPEAVQYEHGVMAALQPAGLPFAIPVPLPTVDGSTVARIRWHDRERLASLSRLVPGVIPKGGNLTQARAGGEALGRLAHALASISPPPGRARYARFGDLSDIHPSVPDPGEAVAAIPIVAEQERQRLLVLLERIGTVVPSLYTTLPRQVVHRDYDASNGNVLFVGDAVSAVLDFEYAAEDLRALDFAIGLTWWPLRDEGERWAAYEAFGRGYAAAQRLTAAEAEAVPMLALLAYYAWLVDFTGRSREGRDPWDYAVPFLVRRVLTFADWWAANEGDLTERLVHWTAEGTNPEGIVQPGGRGQVDSR